jgi:uncharacterized membrane protein
MGFLPGGSQSFAAGISADGTVVVGKSSYFLGPGMDGHQAFRWTEATGMQVLGAGPGGVLTSYASAVSGDGNVIVGMLHPEGSEGAYRWTEAGGITRLPSRLDYPSAISFDGTVILSGKSQQV